MGATRPVRHIRPLGLVATIALVMGNMIGSGVFLLPATLAPYGWNGVAGWLVTIGGALILARLFARMAATRPDAEGPVEVIGQAFGPGIGFMIGWSYWVSIWTANAAIAIAAISYLSPFFPALAQQRGLAVAAALGLLWLMTLLNLRGARTAGQFQFWTLLLKLVPLLVVMVLVGLILVRGDAVAVAPWPAGGLDFGSVNAAGTLTLWALLGLEAASVGSDKVANPARTIPRATMIGTLATGCIYLVVCSGIALLLPPAIASQSNAPFADFVRLYWADGPARWVAGFAAISAIGALNGWILLQGEIPLAMARLGRLPRWMGQTVGPQETPVRAIVLSSLCASLLLLANSLRTMVNIFELMALLSTAATLWLYLACAASAVRLRLAVTTGVIGMGYALWTLWGAGLATSGASLILMISGLPLYYWARRRSAP
jgi:APA family basic amino acid/polyamine antiporter